MSKNVLVTGGLGFIGSHTVVALHNSGFNPIIVDNLSNSRIGILDQIEAVIGKKPNFYQEDVLNTDLIESIILKEQIHSVIHFAALKSVSESLQNPLAYYENNVSGLISVLSAMQSSGCNNIVFSSSCTVYGEPDTIPVDEQCPVQESKTPYGTTKQICETILRENTWLNSIALRYFNPVGGHPTGLLGELPNGEPNNLVPYITQTAAGLRKQLTVFGNDYSTRDGSCIRDFIHVMDLAEAHVKAIERLFESDEKSYEFFNVGTGVGYTVLEVIKKFEEVNGVRVNYRIGPRRDGDIEKIWADTTISSWKLGWTAKRDLAQMMRDAWTWQQHLPGYDIYEAS